MQRIILPISIESYNGASAMVSSSRCVNWIPTVAESKALSSQYLQQQYGLREILNIPGTFRGAITIGVNIYVIYDTAVMRIRPDNVLDNLGAITGNNRVSLATNGSKLVIVADLDSFVLDIDTDTLTQITDIDFLPSNRVTFKDGYFIFSARDGTKFFTSALNDPLSYNALDFGSAELSPDDIVGVHVNRNELFVLGGETIEVFQNIGGAGFPFQRIPGANIQKGVYAVNSVIEFDNTFCFIGGGFNEQASIWKVATSSSVSKISTNAIDYRLQKATSAELSSAFAMTYQINGQFILIFKIGNDVLCYNKTASNLTGRNIWFELDWMLSGIVRRGIETVGFNAVDKIGVMERSALKYFDEPINREVISKPFYGDGLPTFEGEFELLAETGLVTDNSQPVIRYSYSDDGGKTFSSEVQRGIAFKGGYERRVVWRRQGRFPITRMIKLEISDDVECNLMSYTVTSEAAIQ